MPILEGTGNTLLCSRFAYSKRISTPAKSVNSEHRHDRPDSEPSTINPQPSTTAVAA
jgi:hypothetical protein